MKKVIYLISILFTVALLSTSCEKDEPIIPDGITVNDLLGEWHFDSLKFDINGNGVIDVNEHYTDDLSDLENAGYAYYALNLLVTTEGMQFIEPDFDLNPDDVKPYTFENNIITYDLWNGSYSFKFEIVNTDTFFPDKDVLVLKLIMAFGNEPIGGIYTLEKQ